MSDSDCTRRSVLKRTLGLTCATCAASSSTDSVTAQSRQSSSAEWNVLDVENYPFSIQYRSGYQSDAKQVREWAIFGHDSVQQAYSHTLGDPITFDVYPDSEWSQSHGTMVYNPNKRSASMVAPSEYDGGYSDTALYYRHGVTHEYVHAAQNDSLSFHTHANWMMEGYAEAVSVYYTDENIYNEYHVEHHRARETRRDIERGFGYLLGVNEYVYRGSMHLLKFMFEEYGAQAVGEIFEQDADNILEAIQMRLDITALDLEAAWLSYAQREIGGDYAEEIERLGGTVTGLVSIESASVSDSGSITVDEAVYNDDDYALVVLDEQMDIIGESESFAAGERHSDVKIPLNRQIPEPQQVTVRLHHADQSEAGKPVTIDGNRVSQTVIYSTSQAAVRFTSPPTPDDATVAVSVFVAEEYETGKGDAMLRIMNGDNADWSNMINDTRMNFSPGEGVAGVQVTLDESTDPVPLSDGQTITANLIDDMTGETMASATQTVTSDQAGPGTLESMFDDGDGTIQAREVLAVISAYNSSKKWNDVND